jgi:hypothetical protein
MVLLVVAGDYGETVGAIRKTLSSLLSRTSRNKLFLKNLFDLFVLR